MTDSPKIHYPGSIRLKGYDYSRAGAYFITICCQNLECKFGNIVGAGFTPAHNNENTHSGNRKGLPLQNRTVNEIVGGYKSIVANECLKIFKSRCAGVNPERAGVNPAPTMGKLWQLF
jgi:hypothetical protein